MPVTSRVGLAGLQRLVTVENIDAKSGLGRAILHFDAIEQQDLSPEEFNLLKARHQRFMPLLGRFGLARGTTLRIGTGSASDVGDMALTSLIGVTASARVDEERAELFYECAANKQFVRFEVRVRFNARRVKAPGDDPTALNHVGALLQAFTHEMAAHAENMLDYTEGYWSYCDGKGPEPPRLHSASVEHKALKGNEVERYEFMTGRIGGIEAGNIGAAFKNRAVGDMMTAK
jgi:hypothetical protein